MIGLDTNILLRWLIDDSIWPDDSPGQTAAVERLLLTSGKTFFVNHIVVAEVIWVVANGMKQPRGVVAEIIDRLLHSSNVEIDRRNAVIDALAAYREQPGDFPDHLIAAVNSAADCSTTMTFDRKASRAGRFTRLTFEDR